jgi:ribA/ribD-fused uncharacterized protein
MENAQKEIKGFYKEYRYLDNFFVRLFDYDGKTYPTVEHAFQAAKTLNPEMKESIRKAATPAEAKFLGRQAIIRPDWESIKYQIMFDVVKAKFEQHPDLMRKLLDTGSAYLEETNRHHDNTWGNCVCDKCINIEAINWLGEILMRIRNDAFFTDNGILSK